MKDTYFITGATGFLGQYVVAQIANRDCDIYLLIRPKSLDRAKQLYNKFSNITYITGDLTNTVLIHNEEIIENLQKKITHIFHIAAYYNLQASYSDGYLHNVIGSLNCLNFAEECKSLKYFDYISTMAIAGKHDGTFTEIMFDEGQDFENHYAKTKFMAEQLVRDSKIQAQKKIYRMGILIGDSQTGHMPKVDGPYYFLEFLNKFRKLPQFLLTTKYTIPLFLPYNTNAELPIIPVDKAAKAILKLHNLKTIDKLSTYHLIRSNNKVLLQNFITDAFKAYNLPFKPIAFSQKNLIKSSIKNVKLPIPYELIDYMYLKANFDQENTIAALKEKDFGNYHEYRSIIFSTAKQGLGGKLS